MLDKWYEAIKIPLTVEQFHKLPQNRAYKYEYFDNQAWLTPRPKSYHALLDLNAFEPPIKVGIDEAIAVRPVADADWEGLPKVFAAAFHRVQPFASLDQERQTKAAEECLGRTREGEDGPLIRPACFVAERESDGAVVGGLLTTLAPKGDLTDFGTLRWKESPPPDVLERTLGRPHLTWVFVSPRFSGHGVGTALLVSSVNELKQLGYTELASTFLLGNEASTLWHWRIGFQLLAYPGSTRLIRERVRTDHRQQDG